jgi:hypothetical protein
MNGYREREKKERERREKEKDYDKLSSLLVCSRINKRLVNGITH